ncbi:general transcription factor IIH subunit 2 Ssl1 [Dermatophagoides farinae]|uniref:General transcription factor IIH subunit n=1 Tax=Dermatophagoides farinae TaxID=6954 RepID=A0A922HSL1_DERFA|nr:general transcription factor IIH subunit 2-like [Dermatophagoides farinae]KAH7637535.1 ral transcription factor iih subunit 2-like protein [Dermatophagoides farinae]KAH9501988.1 General transcription factor IIH subunit 2 [Dermatophagoides farinae]
MDDEDGKSYRWETEYEKTWEIIKEDDQGRIQGSVDEMLYKAIRKRTLNKKNIRLGLMRHLAIIIDMSSAMNQIDLKPNRLICCVRLLEKFVQDFVDQNPISQLCFISTKNKRAEKISELGGNIKTHLEALNSLKMNASCNGETSMQNALQIAHAMLRYMPPHTSKEILFIMGSLTSCDPSDIHKTIDLLAKDRIRCSVIGLAAEVYVCTNLTQKTNGVYNVATDETHLKDLLFQYLNPLPSTYTESTLMKIGFPKYEMNTVPSICVCHLDDGDEPKLTVSGYFCRQCNSKYCDLPVECKICGLTLLSSSHLARSYHHLFPVEPFSETIASDSQGSRCFGCLKRLNGKSATLCNLCQQIFCVECDVIIHDISHVCPGCTSVRRIP